MCARGGLTSGELQMLLVREGWDCSTETVRRWLRGISNPSANVIPFLLKALAKKIPVAEVEGSFELWLSSQSEPSI
jgi:hypothetical protein